MSVKIIGNMDTTLLPTELNEKLRYCLQETNAGGTHPRLEFMEKPEGDFRRSTEIQFTLTKDFRTHSSYVLGSRTFTQEEMYENPILRETIFNLTSHKSETYYIYDRASLNKSKYYGILIVIKDTPIFYMGTVKEEIFESGRGCPFKVKGNAALKSIDISSDKTGPSQLANLHYNNPYPYTPSPMLSRKLGTTHAEMPSYKALDKIEKGTFVSMHTDKVFATVRGG